MNKIPWLGVSVSVIEDLYCDNRQTERKKTCPNKVTKEGWGEPERRGGVWGGGGEESGVL